MFFAAENLVTQTVTPCVPWEFRPTVAITEQIRHDKEARQQFYQSVATKHCFYTMLEGANSNQRVSKENPPRCCHGIAVDYDVQVPNERIEEAVRELRLKPSYIEKSFGLKPRLIFEFPFPVPLDDYNFSVHFLQHAEPWLGLQVLPGLDAGALTTPTRLLCNGCDWKATGHGPLKAEEVQAFFVRCGRDYKFEATTVVSIPLARVGKAIQEKFKPDWPGDFILGSQGPSFWVPGSTSPRSAIVKEDGMFTFSQHAVKPFYTWADILGPEFIRDYSTDAIAKATKDIYWDEKNFWRCKKGREWCALTEKELSVYMEMECGIPPVVPKGKPDLYKLSLNHIYNENYVSGTGPFVFRKPGVRDYRGRRWLNTYLHNLIEPATGPVKPKWGPNGEFPFLSALIEGHLRDNDPLQYWLGWFQYFYNCGLSLRPEPGTMIIGSGEVGCGKTLLNREIVGYAVGGWADASRFLVDGETFNSYLFHVPHWCVDDDTVSDQAAQQARLQAICKKMIANTDFASNEKFRKIGMIEWKGRIYVTTNLDYASSRIVSTLENGTADKIGLYHFFKPFDFPSRTEIRKNIDAEIRYFLRWITEYKVPDFVPRCSRFGFKPWHDKGMLEAAHLSSRNAPFKEILIDTLLFFFETHPQATEWRGTLTKLQVLIGTNSNNESAMRSLKLDQINRYMESVQRDKCLKCHYEPGPFKQRIWVFPRFSAEPPLVVNPPIPESTGAINIFSK